jgi:hypothetical protein
MAVRTRFFDDFFIDATGPGSGKRLFDAITALSRRLATEYHPGGPPMLGQRAGAGEAGEAETLRRLLGLRADRQVHAIDVAVVDLVDFVGPLLSGRVNDHMPR